MKLVRPSEVHFTPRMNNVEYFAVVHGSESSHQYYPMGKGQAVIWDAVLHLVVELYVPSESMFMAKPPVASYVVSKDMAGDVMAIWEYIADLKGFELGRDRIVFRMYVDKVTLPISVRTLLNQFLESELLNCVPEPLITPNTA